MGILGARKWKITIKKISEKDFSSVYFIVALQYNVQIARDTENNLLVQ